jgi:hypothetical protein
MKAKLLLRIAAGLILIHLLGHSRGHSSWDKPEDQKMQDVVDVMKGYKGEFMGASQSMADYFNGYSLILFVVFAMSIFQLWIASGNLETDSTIVKKMLYPVSFAYIGFSIIELVYFFPFAAGISFLAGIFILWATISGKR